MTDVMSHMKLIDSELFSTRPDANNEIVDAQFFVRVSEDNTPEQVFKLEAMTDKAYAAWYDELTLQRTSEQGTEVTSEEVGVYPLVVPAHVTAARGLVKFVEDSYLNPANPYAVEEIRQFLAPVEPDTTEA